MPLSAQLSDFEPINMTPMIDVVFNLLIFFLLSAAYFSEERQLELSVPTVKASAPVVSGPREWVVNVKADGTMLLNDEKVDARRLEDKLRQARKNYPDQAVAIRGDEAARYQWIADVLAICRRSGIRRIDAVVQEAK